MQAKKELGQNFLKNDGIINKIVSSFNVSKNDLILEIGPGLGALTKRLVNKGAKLLCIELDIDMYNVLSKIDGATVIYGDVLELDIKDILSKYQYDNLYVVGNLPYYITTPIIERLIKLDINPKEMVFMVQDEVAKRLSSEPGNSEYGYMTVFLNEYYDVFYEFFVDKSCFNPVPKVNSAVIKLANKKNATFDEKYDLFLKKCFLHKRKTLRNNLSDERELLDNFLLEAGIPSSIRAEEMSNVDFHKLYLYLNKK